MDEWRSSLSGKRWFKWFGLIVHRHKILQAMRITTEVCTRLPMIKQNWGMLVSAKSRKLTSTREIAELETDMLSALEWNGKLRTYRSNALQKSSHGYWTAGAWSRNLSVRHKATLTHAVQVVIPNVLSSARYWVSSLLYHKRGSVSHLGGQRTPSSPSISSRDRRGAPGKLTCK